MHNMPFILLMLGLGSFIALMVWWDYRRLGRVNPKGAALEMASAPLAVWELSGEQMKAAQRTERLGRFERVEGIIVRNFKVALWFDGVIAGLFTILIVISVYSRGEPVTADYVINYLKVIGAIVGFFTLIIGGVTVMVIFDALGVRALLTFLGFWDNTAIKVKVFPRGVLFEPGGFQRLNYRVFLARVLKGDGYVIQVRTASGKRAQDLYVPVPKGREAEAEEVATKLMR